MKIIPREISQVVPETYLPFSAYVIQTRALPDSRDCLKTGGRYILWSQYLKNNVFNKNRVKGADVVGAVMHWNPHGDAGIYKTLVRMAKPFAMRYLLEDPKGSVGTMTAGDDHTSMRYIELRSSKLASEFTNLVKKDTIDVWKMNYTQEDEYPSVFPTLFPNFVNGNTGIGVGCISNIPTFNLKEAIDSLKKLVYNREASYDDIFIMPDFPTGATIINADEVKESLRTGKGKAIKLRAVIEYDENENALIVKEVPYQVFTNRIMGEIEKGIDEGRIQGIKSFFDGTDKSCGKYGTQICIYLNKGADPQRLCRQLYKETALQDSFTICQLMLENGIVPKVYGLKEMMLAYLDHATSCLRKSYIFDYKKVAKAIHLNEGKLIALAHIDEIVELIKTSETEADVVNIFKEKFGLSEAQTEVILKIELRKLMKLEAVKIEKELEKQRVEADRLNMLINDEETFEAAFIKELDRIAETYGDERRTKVLNLDYSIKDDDTPIEKKELLIYYTSLGNIYTHESTTLMRTKRGTKGSKNKMGKNEVVERIISDSNLSSLFLFTNKGKMHCASTSDLPINGKINVNELFNFESGEKPTALTTFTSNDRIKYLFFITKNGTFKKTEVSEYNIRRGKSLKAINLKDNDEVVSVLFGDTEQVGILTNNGNYIIIDTDDITAIGRGSTGVRGIKLSDGDYVIDAKLIKKSDTHIIVLSKDGLIKKTNLSEYPTCTRATKGKRISAIKENDSIVKFLTISSDCDIIIVSKDKTIKISTKELRELSRNAVGVKAFDIGEKDFAKDLRRDLDE